MTRVLSELLGASEPLFSRNLRQLEAMAGHPSTDVRLTSEVLQGMQAKLHELGLDKHDTTGAELYHVLGERLRRDEERFQAALRTVAGTDDRAAIAAALQSVLPTQTVFAMKPTVARGLLRGNVPKKTMKALGYRSLDSMLKHETPASLFAAAWLVESTAWARRMLANYSRLRAVDFEARKVSIEHPSSKRWDALGDNVVAAHRHNVLSFKELGAVVLLPLPSNRPRMASLLTAALTVHGVHDIRVASAYLKLQQVQPHFGAAVRRIVASDPTVSADNFDTQLSWHGLYEYLCRFAGKAGQSLLEPLVTAEELIWTPVEQVLARIEPTLEFWEQTAHLGMRHGGQTVSCNLTDSLLSHANGLPFGRQSLHHFKQSLQNELMLRYMQYDKLEQTALGGAAQQMRLAPEMAMA